MAETYHEVTAEKVPRSLVEPGHNEYTPEAVEAGALEVSEDLYNTLSEQGRDLETEWYGFEMGTRGYDGELENVVDITDTDLAMARYNRGHEMAEADIFEFETEDELVRGTITYVPRDNAHKYLEGDPRERQHQDMLLVQAEIAAEMLPAQEVMEIGKTLGSHNHTLGFGQIGKDDFFRGIKELKDYVQSPF